MNPLKPFDLAPKDGDFARYIEQLVEQSAQRMREAEPKSSWSSIERAPGATRVDPVPNVAPDTNLLRQSGDAGDAIAARFQQRPDPGLRSAASMGRGTIDPGDAESLAKTDAAITAPSWGRTLPAGGSASPAPGAQRPDGPPDLAELAGGLLRNLAKVTGAIGIVWLLLGAFFEIVFFADTVFVAMMLIFIAIFIHNQRRRPASRSNDRRR